MPLRRSIRSGARAVRELLTRAHSRADLLPRLPFGVAFALAAVALVVAVDHDPRPDEATVTVDELPSGPPTFYGGPPGEEAADLEILEYGFAKITGEDGRERMIAAAVVRNPHDADMLPGGLSVRTESEAGTPVTVEDFYFGMLPPESTVEIGYVLTAYVEEIEPEELRLTAAAASVVYRDDEAENWYAAGPVPEVEFVGVEPLTSPDGYRVYFRAESAAAVDVQISVLFRDGEGRLLGGMPATVDPLSEYGSAGSYRLVPEGESLQHFDLRESWIPAGADLDAIEVGPSR